MVKKPNFKIEANGTDVTSTLKRELISLNFTDNANNDADTLLIEVAEEFVRPKYKDELKLFLGYEDELTFCGLFCVQTTQRRDNYILSISATSVDFSNVLKEKRDITYEKVSIKDICSQIAKRNNLELKSDFDDIFITSIAQSNESDLHFLNRIAKDYNAIFNIKNNTLIFTKKINNNKKNEELPTYKKNANDCIRISIKHSNKLLYKSCKSIWHDTKENKIKEIVVGSGEPTLINKGSFKDEAEAKIKAIAKLDSATRGIVLGTLALDGSIIFAGGTLDLIGALENDGEYTIKKVSHTFDESGWVTNLEFER